MQAESAPCANTAATTHEERCGSARATLALVVITLNEASNLPRCLESVRALADEIVLVDSGSIDTTLDIARAAGARVLHHDFAGYGPQKQFALEQAHSDWLLCLDADEWLDRAARDAIQGILSSGTDEQVNGLSLRCVTFYMGRWVKYGPWAGERKLRLVRRGRARWAPDSVHESLRLIRGKVQRLDGRILHFPYADLGHHLAKLDHYTDLIAVRDIHISRLRALFGVSLEPLLVFLHRYIVQLGFRDGLQGLVGCGMTGLYFFLRYGKILLRQRGLEHRRPPPEPP